MSEPTDYWLIRLLPRPVTPFPQESETSYLHRLAEANGIRPQRALAQSYWLESRQSYIDRLSVASGQPPESLMRAIPNLGQKSMTNHPQRPDFFPGVPCRLCVARRTGSYDRNRQVTAWRSRFHDQVCLRHRLWIGQPAGHYLIQADLSDLPDVLHAQQRHHRLLHEHGPAVLSKCYEYGAALWTELAGRSFRQEDTARRVRALPLLQYGSNRNHRRLIAHYPETVTTTALYASPYWRSLALAEGRGFHQLVDEFNNRLQVELIPRFDGTMWFDNLLKGTADRVERSLTAYAERAATRRT
ncbi:TniQ family protein [Streptomyces sp. NPDC093510]|uniref:TniQ family protein n=1 Tax=Streptomyces sp. NPDC093510 TaxID=3155199 RepID=UPI00343C3FC5